MNTYVWKVTSMSQIAPMDGYVVLAQYTVSASNGATPPVTASIDGSSQFSPQENKTNYIPYEEITEAEVLAWIQSEPNLVINTEANLDGQIQSQIKPPISLEVTPLPWATE